MKYINQGKRDILIFPQFEQIEKIENIRKQYDELFGLVAPHITLAFPFDADISNEQLQQALLAITADIQPFRIKCKGITLHKDENVQTYYIFLNIVEGQETLKELHTRIYASLSEDLPRLDFPYEPHITLGTTNNPEEVIQLADEFETIVNRITVERIGKQEESILEFEIDL